MLGAVLLGFLLAFYALMYALLLATAARVDGVFAAFAAVYLAISALNAWGAVQAVLGRSGRVLKLGGAVVAVLSAVGIVTSLVGDGVGLWPFLLLAAGAGIVVLLNRPASREWFALDSAR